MADFNENLWAPWRMQYIRSLSAEAKQDGCFLCRYWQNAEADTENHVIWRGKTAFAVMNKFPYTNGHLLIAHAEHVGDLTELPDEATMEMSVLIREAVALLRQAIGPQGFNIGYNIGHCAGAGLPDHLHAHIVPRWSGDTNYMAVVGNARVIPDAIETLYSELRTYAKAAGLRT